LHTLYEVKKNPLRQLEALGQSVWLDDLRRGNLLSGQLARWIADDGVRGLTSNPTIFERSIAHTHDYDSALNHLAGHPSPEVYEALAVEDIRLAADVFRPTYDRTGGADGFVSIEVSPRLAHDTAGTIAEARRLWREVDRPNAMVKVPATDEGLPAIEQLTADGINVNITLLFGLPRYRQVLDRYFAGLEQRSGNLYRIASVASFFLSRIDTLIDRQLDARHPLRGTIAIASAKLAHQMFEQAFTSSRFKAIAARGARIQRLLWASTGTKDPAYPDLKYVEPLIGMNTISTMPLATFAAFRDHGTAAVTLDRDVELAAHRLRDLEAIGLHLDDATRQLETEGVAKFVADYDALLAAISRRPRLAG
jgi:transaldolase